MNKMEKEKAEFDVHLRKLNDMAHLINRGPTPNSSHPP